MAPRSSPMPAGPEYRSVGALRLIRGLDRQRGVAIVAAARDMASAERSVTGEGVIYLLWGDLTGLARCRGLPSRSWKPGPRQGDCPAIEGAVCDSRAEVDRDWDCCARNFLRRLDDPRAETGLKLIATFEHEFLFQGEIRIRFDFVRGRAGRAVGSARDRGRPSRGWCSGRDAQDGNTGRAIRNQLAASVGAPNRRQGAGDAP